MENEIELTVSENSRLALVKEEAIRATVGVIVGAVVLATASYASKKVVNYVEKRRQQRAVIQERLES